MGVLAKAQRGLAGLLSEKRKTGIPLLDLKGTGNHDYSTGAEFSPSEGENMPLGRRVHPLER